MNYRYHTGRALRVQGSPFGLFEGTELKSEDFDSIEDFLAVAVEMEMELIQDLEEGAEDDEETVADLNR